MIGKKNVLSYIICILYILTMGFVVYFRIISYDFESFDDLSMLGIALCFPLFLILVMFLIGNIIKSIKNKSKEGSDSTTVASKGIIYIILFVILGIALRVLSVMYAPESAHLVTEEAFNSDVFNIYSDTVNIIYMNIVGNAYAVISVNFVFSVLLMVFSYLFVRFAAGRTAGFITLIIMAVSPYELIRINGYSPEIMSNALLMIVLALFAIFYKRYFENDSKKLNTYAAIIIVALINGLFFVVSPAAVILAVAVFIFWQFKGFLKAFIYLAAVILVIAGFVYASSELYNNTSVNNHLDRMYSSYINIDSLDVNDVEEHFEVLQRKPAFDSDIMPELINDSMVINIVDDAFILFLCLLSIVGTVFMFKRERTIIHLYMLYAIIAVPLSVIPVINVPLWFTVYPCMICVGGFAIFNMFSTGKAEAESYSDYVITTDIVPLIFEDKSAESIPENSENTDNFGNPDNLPETMTSEGMAPEENVSEDFATEATAVEQTAVEGTATAIGESDGLSSGGDQPTGDQPLENATPDSTYGLESNYVTTDSTYGTEPTYGTTDNSYSTEPTYGKQDEPYDNNTTYGTPDDTYGTEPTYGTPDNSYRTEPTYGTQDDPYDNNTTYGTPDDTYGTEPAYGSPDNSYGTEPTYGTQDDPYDNNTTYGTPDDTYGTEPAYGTPDSFYSTESTNDPLNNDSDNITDTNEKPVPDYMSDDYNIESDYKYYEESYESTDNLYSDSDHDEPEVNDQYTVYSNDYNDEYNTTSEDPVAEDSLPVTEEPEPLTNEPLEYDNDDYEIYNVLPTPKPILPDGMDENSFVIKDYQDYSKLTRKKHR